MIVKKGQTFTVHDKRKGIFRGIATEDFDTEKNEFYPVVALEYVVGLANDWEPGEKIPCRRGISTIEI